MQKTGSSARILVVDDDLMTRKLFNFLLMDAGYAVVAADSVSAASRYLEREEIHLIILDVGLPHINGLDYCRKLREVRYTVPIMFVSGRQQTDDKLAGFDAGADDYVSKPIEPREFLARVRALLSRQLWGTSSGAHTKLRAGGLQLDISELSVRRADGRQMQLTPTEMRVLQCLLRNAGRVVTRDHLLTEAWGYDYESDSNQVEVYIRRLRRKVDPDPEQSCIETIRGLGYRLLANKQGVGKTEEPVAAAG
jgi:DNA-binding response OmpR family regulator